MRQLEEKLREKLDLRGSHLVGCVRRNLWSSGETPWRIVRGNALPAVVGEKHAIQTPAGVLEFFLLHDNWLLQFRAGTWKDYWREDFFRLWSLIQMFSNFKPSHTIVLLHENRGELTIRHIPVPEDLDVVVEVREALEEYRADPTGRIAKNQPRAYNVCRYCPVQARCDAVDIQRGEDDDWSDDYRDISSV